MFHKEGQKIIFITLIFVVDNSINLIILDTLGI